MDGKKLMCTIRGSISQLVWITVVNIVLLGLRDLGDDMKAEIITKHFDKEAKELKELGEIQEHGRIKEKFFDPDSEIWVSKWAAVITRNMMTKRNIKYIVYNM